MTPLQERIAARIQQNGPLPFAAFMAMALYDRRDGYYAHHPRTGWGGHFVTSPEIDVGFGALWCRFFEEVWRRAGEPSRFDVIEIGPGEGGFARAVLGAADASFADALRITLVEQMWAARDRQAARIGDDERVSWIASLDEAAPTEVGCVFANEVLDNLPVHIVEMTRDRIAEVFVAQHDHELVEELGEPSTRALEVFLRRHTIELPRGHRVEIPLAAEGFVRRAASLVDRGAIVFVDYGARADELLLHPAGTLTCYSPAGADATPLVDPGTKDITAHVNWNAVIASLEDAAATVSGPRPQAEVLRALGVSEVDRGLHEAHDEALKGGRGVDAVAALSRRNALRVLLDPGGLGALQVVTGWRGIEPVNALAEKEAGPEGPA